MVPSGASVAPAPGLPVAGRRSALAAATGVADGSVAEPGGGRAPEESSFFFVQLPSSSRAMPAPSRLLVTLDACWEQFTGSSLPSVSRPAQGSRSRGGKVAVMTQATDPKALEPGQREMLRKKLLEERGKLSARHSSELRASEGLRSEVEDEGDAASRANGEDALVSLAEVDHQRLREIERALAKFALGTYGLDEETGEPIEFARLAIIPWARHAARTEETRQR
jgi:RNA polymerase-binding transcription factor DksA